MQIEKTHLNDCYEIIPSKFGDSRGYFSPYFIEKEIHELFPSFGDIKQLNRSMSSKGVIRGLHYQREPYTQSKIVEVINGSALDVVVDIRKDSSTYGDWVMVHLNPEKGNMLYVPRGFAHGFIALEDNTIFQYIVDNEYKPSYEAGIIYNDPKVNIPWEQICHEYGIENLQFSDKDLVHPTLSACKDTFSCLDKKFLITGYNGQLGYDIKRELLSHGYKEHNILAVDINEMDITNKEMVDKVIDYFKPDVIFHCAAYTNVDKAGLNEELAYKINVLGTKYITDASIRNNSKLIYVSTDYVFDGKKDGVYYEDDEPNPLSEYGRTKYLGELEAKRNPKHFIARTSWVFGINGNNFVKTMLRAGENHSEVFVVDDQIGSPTYTPDLANKLVEMAFSEKYGTYHVNNSGYCSWAEFTEVIYEANGMDTLVNHVSTKEYNKDKVTAIRPMNSKLDHTKLEETFGAMPEYTDAVKRYAKELKLNRPIIDIKDKKY